MHPVQLQAEVQIKLDRPNASRRRSLKRIPDAAAQAVIGDRKRGSEQT